MRRHRAPVPCGPGPAWAAAPRAVVVLLALMVGGLAATVGAVATAAPAWAHAALVGTTPAAGERLGAPPEAVVLRFDEGVSVDAGGVRLLDAGGTARAVGRPRTADGGRVVEASLPSLGDGAYVVAWRVQSLDGHPVNGAFTFRVGTGGAEVDPALVDELARGGGDGGAVERALSVARLAGYGGLALLIGGVVVASWVWPRGAGHVKVHQLLGVGALLVGAGAVASFALQGPYVAGTGWRDALRPAQWGEVLDSRVGRALAARAVLVVVAVAPLLGALRVRGAEAARSAAWRAAVVATGAGLVATVVLAGHASAGHAVAVGVVADVVHVLAMAAWLGGLVFVALAVLPFARRGDGPAALARWGRLAAGSVAALAASGVVQGWRQMGTLDGLLDSSYGRTLALKVGLVAAMLVVAGRARRGLGAAAAAAPGDPPRLRLASRVGVEVVLGAVVLAVTASLANLPPPRVAPDSVVNVTLVQDRVLAQVTLDPARAGANEVHVVLSSTDGTLRRFDQVRVRMRLPERQLGPVELPVEAVGPNHVAAYGVDIPFAGTWSLEVLASEGPSAQLRLATEVRIR